MLRRAILISVLVALVSVGVLAGCDSEEVRDSSNNQDQASAVEETREQASQPVTQRESGGEVERTAEETSEEQLCTEQEKTNAEREEIRIGDFAPPEGVPAYEVLEEEQVERDCVRAVRLLVDTQSKSEADYTLIAREIKSEYQDLDAVTIEF